MGLNSITCFFINGARINQPCVPDQPESLPKTAQYDEMILKSRFLLYSEDRILTLGPEVPLAAAKIRLKMLEAFFKSPIQMPPQTGGNNRDRRQTSKPFLFIV